MRTGSISLCCAAMIAFISIGTCNNLEVNSSFVSANRRLSQLTVPAIPASLVPLRSRNGDLQRYVDSVYAAVMSIFIPLDAIFAVILPLPCSPFLMFQFTIMTYQLRCFHGCAIPRAESAAPLPTPQPPTVLYPSSPSLEGFQFDCPSTGGSWAGEGHTQYELTSHLLRFIPKSYDLRRLIIMELTIGIFIMFMFTGCSALVIRCCPGVNSRKFLPSMPHVERRWPGRELGFLLAALPIASWAALCGLWRGSWPLSTDSIAVAVLSLLVLMVCVGLSCAALPYLVFTSRRRLVSFLDVLHPAMHPRVSKCVSMWHGPTTRRVTATVEVRAAPATRYWSSIAANFYGFGVPREHLSAYGSTCSPALCHVECDRLRLFSSPSPFLTTTPEKIVIPAIACIEAPLRCLATAAANPSANIRVTSLLVPLKWAAVNLTQRDYKHNVVHLARFQWILLHWRLRSLWAMAVHYIALVTYSLLLASRFPCKVSLSMICILGLCVTVLFGVVRPSNYCDLVIIYPHAAIAILSALVLAISSTYDTIDPLDPSAASMQRRQWDLQLFYIITSLTLAVVHTAIVFFALISGLLWRRRHNADYAAVYRGVDHRHETVANATAIADTESSDHSPPASLHRLPSVAGQSSSYTASPLSRLRNSHQSGRKLPPAIPEEVTAFPPPAIHPSLLASQHALVVDAPTIAQGNAAIDSNIANRELVNTTIQLVDCVRQMRGLAPIDPEEFFISRPGVGRS